MRRPGSSTAVVVDPGDEADATVRSTRAARASRRSSAILITHCHFDHVGAVKATSRGDRRAGLRARAGAGRAGEHQRLRAARASARSRATRPTTPSTGGEALELAGLTFDVRFTPGHSPGHVTYSVRGEDALLSGDVLFQGSVGRVDLPGRRLADAARLDRVADRRVPGETPGLPGPHGRDHARRRARHEPVPPRARAPREPRRTEGGAAMIQAPKGTYDVLPQDMERRRALAGARRADPRRRRIPPDRDAGVRGDRAVRPRRRRGDGHRPEGDVHLRRRRRPLADAAPGGHRAGLPRVHRARHAQAPAAGEALVPVVVLPRRAAAEGPLPPVLAGRRRGDRRRRDPRPTPR